MPVQRINKFWWSLHFWSNFGGPYSVLPTISLDLYPSFDGSGLTESETSLRKILFSFLKFRCRIDFGVLKSKQESNWNNLAKYGKNKYGSKFPDAKYVKEWCLSPERLWVKKMIDMTGTSNHYTRSIIAQEINMMSE